MTYQEWCIEAINVILNMEDLDESQYGYKMLIKDIVRHYPEVFMDDGEQIHFWARHVSEKCMRSFKRSFVESLILTRQAHDVIEGGTVKDVHDNLYQEHITPVQYVFEKLKKLRDQNRISAEEIRKCMAQNKLVLLHRSEKSVLDGKRFTRDDFTCLEGIIKEGGYGVRHGCHRYAKQSSAELIAEGAIS